MKPGKSKQSGTRENTNRVHSRRYTLLLAAFAALGVLAAAFWAGVGRTSPPAEPGKENSPQAPAAAKVDLQRLVGNWVRSDGGYVLSIRRIAANGRVEAAYLNPRPINVSRAEASAAGETAKLFIELRDAGYPGSTYELIYDSRSDRLAGIYFQAAIGQRYDVVFIRKKQ